MPDYQADMICGHEKIFFLLLYIIDYQVSAK